MNIYAPTTINDVTSVLEPLLAIERPYGDNEGSAINSPYVYDYLSVDEQRAINHARQVVRDYITDGGGEPNGKAIAVMNRRGYHTSFGQDQYEPYRLAGSVRFGEWLIDISDSA